MTLSSILALTATGLGGLAAGGWYLYDKYLGSGSNRSNESAEYVLTKPPAAKTSKPDQASNYISLDISSDESFRKSINEAVKAMIVQSRPSGQVEPQPPNSKTQLSKEDLEEILRIKQEIAKTDRSLGIKRLERIRGNQRRYEALLNEYQHQLYQLNNRLRNMYNNQQFWATSSYNG